MPDYPRRATTNPASRPHRPAGPKPEYGNPANSPNATHPRPEPDHTRHARGHPTASPRPSASPEPDHPRRRTDSATAGHPRPPAGPEPGFPHGAGSPTAGRAQPAISSSAARPHAASPTAGLSTGFSGEYPPSSPGGPGGRSGPVPSYLRRSGEDEHELPPVRVTVLHGRWGDGRDLVPETGAESPVWPGDPFWQRDRDETEPGAVRRAAGGVGSWWHSLPLWLKASTGAAAALALVVGVSLALRDGGSPQQAAAVGNTTTTLGTTTTSTTTTASPPSAAPALTPPSVVRTTTTTAPTTTIPPTTEPPTTAPPTTEPPPEYRNCWEALRAGALPLERGEPGYGPHLDDDGDGRACEWGEGNGRGTR